MLIEFRVENHRSVRDEQVLTMEAGRVGDANDERPRTVQGHQNPLLTVAGLYGPNASGKSNVLSAIAFMREAVLRSHRAWPPDEGVPRDPFAWGAKRSEPSTFEVTVLVDATRYEYGFVATDAEFIEEWLHAWPHGKKQLWFAREAGRFKFGENLKGENALIEEVTRPNALFLSAAVQHKHVQLQPIFSWFQSLQAIRVPSPRRSPFQTAWGSEFAVAELFEESRQSTLFETETEEPFLERFRAMLRNADIGIVDLRVIKSEPDDSSRRVRPPRFEFKHHADTNDAWLPFQEESRGTQTLFRITLPILRAIQRGSTLVLDELEASLHPSLAEKIVRQFNDARTNPRNAQLIFTTHDTNLLGTTLGEPALRRDQTWLTEKDPNGATVLYPLTDYKPRKAENLERGYLQGRYGAIPFLGNFAITGQ